MRRKYTARQSFSAVFFASLTGECETGWVPIWVVVSALSGCAFSTAPGAAQRVESVESKLARVGLELVSEREAGIPEKEWGRYVPCRTIASGAPLPEDPAGYLIVGFEGQLSGDASEILAALRDWQKGQTISLWVRRNHYLSADPDWWEVDKLPVNLP